LSTGFSSPDKTSTRTRLIPASAAMVITPSTNVEKFARCSAACPFASQPRIVCSTVDGSTVTVAI
jgi:hypothetical protein